GTNTTSLSPSKTPGRREGHLRNFTRFALQSSEGRATGSTAPSPRKSRGCCCAPPTSPAQRRQIQMLYSKTFMGGSVPSTFPQVVRSYSATGPSTYTPKPNKFGLE
ncbi:hypothetical protein KIL84_013125, partial [Mauremys mutica]